MRFWIVCGLAALAGGRCLADGRLLGRSLFLGRSGGGDRGLFGRLGLSLCLRGGLDLSGLRRDLAFTSALGFTLAAAGLASALGAAALVVVFLAVVVARLRVVVLAAGLASTDASALVSAGVSSTLAAGFAAALVVAAFVVVDFFAVVFLAAVAFLAVVVLDAVDFLAVDLAGALAAGWASAASAFTSGAASTSAAFLAAAVVRLRVVVAWQPLFLSWQLGRRSLLSGRLAGRGLLNCGLCSGLDFGLCLRNNLSLHLRLGLCGLSLNRHLLGLGLLGGHRLSCSLRLVDNSRRPLNLRMHKKYRSRYLSAERVQLKSWLMACVTSWFQASRLSQNRRAARNTASPISSPLKLLNEKPVPRR